METKRKHEEAGRNAGLFFRDAEMPSAFDPAVSSWHPRVDGACEVCKGRRTGEFPCCLQKEKEKLSRARNRISPFVAKALMKCGICCDPAFFTAYFSQKKSFFREISRNHFPRGKL